MINSKIKKEPGHLERENWRFELKYRINYFQYQKLRIAILSHMKSDHFTRIAEGKRYLVRSLYFDTYDYKLFHQKMSGDSDRIKFRLRTYSKSLDEEPVIRAELKVRKANAMEKLGQLITVDHYDGFMRKRHWPEHSNPVLEEFERHLHLEALLPQVLVDYLREGYEDREHQGIRVTFDHRVKSAHSKSLFPGHIFFREHHPHGIVLEIKCRHHQPRWLLSIVSEYGLKLVANSKFTQAIQVARQDLYHPDGVVVIR